MRTALLGFAFFISMAVGVALVFEPAAITFARPLIGVGELFSDAAAQRQRITGCDERRRAYDCTINNPQSAQEADK